MVSRRRECFTDSYRITRFKAQNSHYLDTVFSLKGPGAGGGLPEINISKGLQECVIYFLGDDLRIVSWHSHKSPRH